MTKKMEICKVRNGEHFIVDGEEFVKLDDIAGGAFVLLADTLPDYCAFESEDADDDRDHNNFIGSNVKRVVDEYRKYRRFIPLTDKPFWTATPWCTRSSCSSSSNRACIVYAGGSVGSGVAYGANVCARPALALKSSLLVSVSVEDGEKALCDYTDTELLDELLRRRTEKKEVR